MSEIDPTDWGMMITDPGIEFSDIAEKYLRAVTPRDNNDAMNALTVIVARIASSLEKSTEIARTENYLKALVYLGASMEHIFKSHRHIATPLLDHWAEDMVRRHARGEL